MDCFTLAAVRAGVAGSPQPWWVCAGGPGKLPHAGAGHPLPALAALDGTAACRSKAHLQELSCACVTISATGCVLSKGSGHGKTVMCCFAPWVACALQEAACKSGKHTIGAVWVQTNDSHRALMKMTSLDLAMVWVNSTSFFSKMQLLSISSVAINCSAHFLGSSRSLCCINRAQIAQPKYVGLENTIKGSSALLYLFSAQSESISSAPNLTHLHFAYLQIP